MTSTSQLLQRRNKLLRQLILFPDILNGSFFEREVGGKNRLYLSRMINGIQRQTYIAHKHKSAVKKAIKNHRQLQKTIELLGDVNLQLLKRGEEIG